MGNNCSNPNLFMRIFKSLLKMFVVLMKSIRKAKKELVILLNNKYE